MPPHVISDGDLSASAALNAAWFLCATYRPTDLPGEIQSRGAVHSARGSGRYLCPCDRAVAIHESAFRAANDFIEKGAFRRFACSPF